ncbi:MAG TPA: patatin-like phospholipase family protein [Candidatus Limnocylindrales bacterium]|nr:patatin-like phospholipase family protein [Candidatus Limnocylindrales bacterium]
MSKNISPKIGLALGSGGAKGLAHIGVLKALSGAGIKIDYIAGTSIGSLIGAYYAANPSMEKLEDFILGLNALQGYRLFDPIMKGGIIKGDKIELLINSILKDANFDNLRIPFAAVATDMKSAEEVILRSGDLAKAVRASISVPPVFTPVTFGKKSLADGGLSDPVPVEVVKGMGADIVIAVNAESAYFYTPVKKIPALAGIPMFSVNILRHNLTFHSLKNADIIISPSSPNTGLVGWKYFFDNKKAESIIKAGEEAAGKAIPEIRKLIANNQSIRQAQDKKEKSAISKLFSFFKKFM